MVAPVIDTEVGFDGIGTALKRMESRDVFGKIILRVADRQCTGTAECRTHDGPRLSRCRWLRHGQLLADRAGRAWRTMAAAAAVADRQARWISPTAPRGALGPLVRPPSRRARQSAQGLSRKRARTRSSAIALDMWGNMARLAAEYIFLDQLFDYDPARPTHGRIEVCRRSSISTSASPRRRSRTSSSPPISAISS